MIDTGNQAIRSSANGAGKSGRFGAGRRSSEIRQAVPNDRFRRLHHVRRARARPRGHSPQAPVAETNQDTVRAEAPVARSDISQKQPERPAETLSAPGKSPRRRVLRMALFALLPLVLIAAGLLVCHRGPGGVGGRRLCAGRDGRHLDDISGIVKEVDCAERHQHVVPGQILLPPGRPRQFQIASTMPEPNLAADGLTIAS